MKTVFLSTAYLAPIIYYSKLVSFGQVVIEQHCNYIKQTYRNRCTIATTNGPMTLSIPVEKSDLPKTLTRDIRIATHGNWQHVHWNAMVSAYRSSPYFEYYADDFYPFYEKKFDFLFDFNENLREMICNLLDVTPAISYSEKFLPESDWDFRETIHPKKNYTAGDNSYTFKPYYQVFQDKFGFLPNLSIVDLLFNMGPESIFWLLPET